MEKKLEICCYSVESGVIAQQGGADRIELCDNYSEGGTTPSYASIKHAIDMLDIPVNVIVRSRGGDFLYSQTEFEIIKEDVIMCRELKANGVVIGFLNQDGSVDIGRTREIVELAKPMEVTFHRAFDMCNDPERALAELLETGVDRILTSGQKGTALEGVQLLKQLVSAADGRIIIMPGSGINDENISEISSITNAPEFHSSAKTFVKSEMKYTHKSATMSKDSDEYKKISVDSEIVRKMKSNIR
ncbi:MAG: copper homeostasis protein CutC [bacterium]|nr:copper homeostasis protein CutC [bacterium]